MRGVDECGDEKWRVCGATSSRTSPRAAAASSRGRATATSRGVHTCAQAVLASYPDVVRGHFAVDDDHKLLCGVAVGYEAPIAEGGVVNTFRPQRVSVDELMFKAKE